MYKKLERIICHIILSVLFCTFLFSQQRQSPQGHPSFEPLFLPEDVLENPADLKASLSADEVFRLALLFSECQPDSAEGAACIKKFREIKDRVSGAEFMDLSLEDRGRAVLKYLFTDYLTTYDFDQTRINVALSTGVYNCVSSALLYMAAAKAAGLDVRGQKTTEHAFCSVYIPGSNANGSKKNQLVKIDVETTNPYGFNPGSRESVENEDKIKGYYVVPKKYYANRQEVSDRIFAGLIAGNICSYCIEQKDYQKAIPLGAARFEMVRLEQSRSPAEVRRDFDVLASNYVNTDVEDAVIFSGYVDWYTAFIDRWGMTDFLQKNMDNALYNLLVLCLEEKNYEFASDSFEKNKKYITQKQYSTSQEILADIFFDTGLAGLSAEGQVEVINQTLALSQNNSEAFQKRGKLYLENAWLQILNDFMNRKDYSGGLKKSDQALLQLPKSAKIKTSRMHFYNNCIAIIHNNFAEKANSRKFDDAKKILDEGLLQFPEDKTLKKDKIDLQKIMTRQ